MPNDLYKAMRMVPGQEVLQDCTLARLVLYHQATPKALGKLPCNNNAGKLDGNPSYVP